MREVSAWRRVHCGMRRFCVASRVVLRNNTQHLLVFGAALFPALTPALTLWGSLLPSERNARYKLPFGAVAACATLTRSAASSEIKFGARQRFFFKSLRPITQRTAYAKNDQLSFVAKQKALLLAGPRVSRGNLFTVKTSVSRPAEVQNAFDSADEVTSAATTVRSSNDEACVATQFAWRPARKTHSRNTQPRALEYSPAITLGASVQV